MANSGEHYKVKSSYEGGWDKANQSLNVIYIPSIFYGGRIIMYHITQQSLGCNVRNSHVTDKYEAITMRLIVFFLRDK